MIGLGPHALRAQAAIDLGRYVEALEEANGALRADPTNLAGHALRSQALLGLNRFHDSLEAAETGLAQHPDAEWLHRLRATSLRRLGLSREALDAAKRAMQLAPDEPAAHLVLAYALAGRKMLEQARAAAERAVSLAPESAEAHRTLGDMCQGMPDIARTHYLASLAIHPNNAETLNNLGVALTRLGRRTDAIALFKSALLVDPTFDVAKRNIHLAVRKQLYKSGAAVAAILVIMLPLQLYLFRASQDLHSSRFVVGAGSVILLGLVALGMKRRRHRANQRQLETADPELMAIYRKLEVDKQDGRL